MSLSGWLATLLDERMLHVAGIPIASRFQPTESLPVRSGSDVASELKDRFLLRYMMQSQVGEFLDGSNAPTWTTPTAMPTKDLPDVLALYAKRIPRAYALILDPRYIDEIQGPSWIALGEGIEFLLPKGFSKDAIVDVGEVTVR